MRPFKQKRMDRSKVVNEGGKDGKVKHFGALFCLICACVSELCSAMHIEKILIEAEPMA